MFADRLLIVPSMLCLMGPVYWHSLGGYPPFQTEGAEMTVREQITRGYYRFIPSKWDKISEQAKDLVKKLLVVDPKTRLTIEEALQHPWIQDEQMKDTAFKIMYPNGAPSEADQPSTSRKRPREDKDDEEQPGKRKPGPPPTAAK
ncbi:hypothetical protein JZ751_023479 [Albula glossodonta]|uniref:Protein kinase domain-containing protein n=1 Tax=Albula glossodonta TaxID=121402 RepID=A0A8T2NPU9_9TELE|nr:hypothetical protein JZ751_023479 [Albula glossodonta]